MQDCLNPSDGLWLRAENMARITRFEPVSDAISVNGSAFAWIGTQLTVAIHRSLFVLFFRVTAPASVCHGQGS